jgi:hypothetical protein
MLSDVEIVGIGSGEIGRSCEIHEVCGEHVGVGYLVTFKLVVIEVDGKEEEAIKAIHIQDGTESCHVVFAPFRSWAPKGSSGEKVWTSLGPL